MSTPINKVPYLPEQRTFPNENLTDLAIQSDRAYIDIAQKVNERTIGVYALGAPVVTGNSLYLQGGSQKQQTIRQIYTFTAAGNIAHGISTGSIAGFLQIYGTFTDGTNFYPVPYLDPAGTSRDVEIYIDPTNIVITAGGSAPSITSGFVVLEWIAQAKT